MFSNDKIKVKAIETSCILLGICFLFAALLLMLGYQFFEYRFNKILLTYLIVYAILSLTLLIPIAFRDVKQIKFYKVFGFLIIFVWIFMILYYCIIDNNVNIQFLIIIVTSVLASSAIIFINNLITRVFFWEGDNKNSQDVDSVSSEFAVDVLSIALFLGVILGLFAYLFFVPNQATPSFFGGIDIKTVAIATAGLVTFFWAAKAAKNKSIELEEKKQDGKRRDNEIKMAEARDTAQLIAKASELLGSDSDAQKNAGLAFLNRVASQKNGPLQKEAFDLMADFILSATDTTTANKPRMRAIRYVDNLLEERSIYYNINGFIKISGTVRLGEGFEKANQKYKFNNLDILYSQFYFFPGCGLFLSNGMTGPFIAYDNCLFANFSGQYDFSIIDNIEVDNSAFVNCKIGSITDFSLTMAMFHNGYQNPKMDVQKYKFENCDFSKSEAWSDLSSYIKATPKARQMFEKCFYYAGHAPLGFDKERDGALLTEITSEQQFYELIGKKLFMRYLPPDDKKTPNE